MPLSTRRLFCRFPRTRVIVGEISTAHGRQRRHGRGEDAPHRGMAIIWIERLVGSNCIVMFFFVFSIYYYIRKLGICSCFV